MCGSLSQRPAPANKYTRERTGVSKSPARARPSRSLTADDAVKDVLTMDETFDVVVVGAGVSGMAMGLALQQTDRSFVVLEKAEEVGGTWRDNRYPGLTIDVPAPIYTFTGHRNPDWTRWMPGHREILEYHRDVSLSSGLRGYIRFSAEVVSARWTGTEWIIGTRAGATYRASAVVFASGFLHHPSYPSIPGLETFAGEVVHSARWRDDIE